MSATAAFAYTFTCAGLEPGKLYQLSLIFNAAGTTHDHNSGLNALPADENGVYTITLPASFLTNGGAYAGWVKGWLRDERSDNFNDPPVTTADGTPALVQIHTP